MNTSIQPINTSPPSVFPCFRVRPVPVRPGRRDVQAEAHAGGVGVPRRRRRQLCGRERGGTLRVPQSVWRRAYGGGRRMRRRQHVRRGTGWMFRHLHDPGEKQPINIRIKTIQKTTIFGIQWIHLHLHLETKYKHLFQPLTSLYNLLSPMGGCFVCHAAHDPARLVVRVEWCFEGLDLHVQQVWRRGAVGRGGVRRRQQRQLGRLQCDMYVCV